MRGADGRFNNAKRNDDPLARVPRTADPLSQALNILKPIRVQMSIVDYKYRAQSVAVSTYGLSGVP